MLLTEVLPPSGSRFSPSSSFSSAVSVSGLFSPPLLGMGVFLGDGGSFCGAGSLLSGFKLLLGLVVRLLGLVELLLGVASWLL